MVGPGVSSSRRMPSPIVAPITKKAHGGEEIEQADALVVGGEDPAEDAGILRVDRIEKAAVVDGRKLNFGHGYLGDLGRIFFGEKPRLQSDRSGHFAEHAPTGKRREKFNVDGVAKSPPYGVTAFFQDLDLPDVGLRP